MFGCPAALDEWMRRSVEFVSSLPPKQPKPKNEGTPNMTDAAAYDPTRFDALRRPLRFGRLTAKNRIEAAPSLVCLANVDGSATTELVDYYRAKARGGAGIVTVGESAVDSDYGITHAGQLFLDHDNKIPGLSRIADGIHRYGALASIELCHGGGQTMPGLIGDRPPIAPSVMTSQLHEALLGRKIDVQVMTAEMIEQVIENYAQAALRVKKAGFDMCLLHGGHGWLLAQFTSPRTNKRTDEYGGSLENRARFPLRVLSRIRELCGPEFGIEYRFSADELVPGGLSSGRRGGVRQAHRGSHRPVPHLLRHDGGDAAGAVHPSRVLPAPGRERALRGPAQAVGDQAGDGGGRGGGPRPGREDRRDRPGRHGGHGALPAGRPLPARQDLPRLPGRGDPLHPLQRVPGSGGPVHPRALRHQPLGGAGDRDGPHHAALDDAPKKVVVVGGGPAGLQAAITAAERGHKVVLFERSFCAGRQPASPRRRRASRTSSSGSCASCAPGWRRWAWRCTWAWRPTRPGWRPRSPTGW